MKRTNLVIDEQLLEKARRVTGERTYSAVVNKGLAELVRVADLDRAIRALKNTPDVFWPNYLEELRPNSWAAQERRAEKKAPARRKVTSARRSR